MKNKLFILYILFCCFCFSLFAQEDFTGGSVLYTGMMEQRIMLARSSAGYRVTAGDEYTLTYTVGTNTITYPIVVDSSYRIRVANMGVVNGTGKTFPQIKSEIEALVIRNFALSGAQLVLNRPATFTINLIGEVSSATAVTAWALTRLSSFVDTNQTPFTSIRDITVRSADGTTRVFDLLQATRLGDLSQDPYMRPGDTVIFNRVKRSVTIEGEVERPGTYQLLDNENINELIKFYANDFTLEADTSRIQKIRLLNSENPAGDSVFLTLEDIENNYVLNDRDIITVPKIANLMPVMFVEGAVGDIERIIYDHPHYSSNRIVVRFRLGETYASLVRRNADRFISISDTKNAYILRKDEIIPINLDNALYNISYRGEVFVQENDILVIPFRQFYISVAGAVERPGSYAFLPGMDWEHYIAMAGGFIPNRNFKKKVSIVDAEGIQLNKTDMISPGTTITADTNRFMYYFNHYAPAVTVTLTAISTILTIMILAGR